MRYNEKMAAQIAAFFTYQEGGSIEILKLMKLMYLSERESLKKYGDPLTGDDLYAMENGPNVSLSYDICKHKISSKYWRKWLRDRDGNDLKLAVDDVNEDELTELSEADLEIIHLVWEKYGGMTSGQLIDYTHKNCAEWTAPPRKSSKLIYTKELLKAVGYSEETSQEIEKRISEQKSIESHFSAAD